MKNLLPLGSVVLLKDAQKKIMIIGRIQIQANGEGQKIYDYSGVLYPEGFVNPRKLFLFNNNDIERVYYIGMQDEEEFQFRDYIFSKLKEAQEK